MHPIYLFFLFLVFSLSFYLSYILMFIILHVYFSNVPKIKKKRKTKNILEILEKKNSSEYEMSCSYWAVSNGILFIAIFDPRNIRNPPNYLIIQMFPKQKTSWEDARRTSNRLFSNIYILNHCMKQMKYTIKFKFLSMEINSTKKKQNDQPFHKW